MVRGGTFQFPLLCCESKAYACVGVDLSVQTALNVFVEYNISRPHDELRGDSVANCSLHSRNVWGFLHHGNHRVPRGRRGEVALVNGNFLLIGIQCS